MSARLKDFLEEFSALSTLEEREDCLLELAGELRPLPGALAVRPFPKEHLVPDCPSQVYVWLSGAEDCVDIHFAVENPQGVTAKALAAVLQQTLAGEKRGQLASLDEGIVFRIFGEGLGLQKSVGLRNLVRKVRSLAQEL